METNLPKLLQLLAELNSSAEVWLREGARGPRGSLSLRETGNSIIPDLQIVLFPLLVFVLFCFNEVYSLLSVVK